LILILLLFANTYAGLQNVSVQDDTVKAPDAAAVPVIDASGDDACWQNVPWQSIDQVWIDYGKSVDPKDYTGRYKVVWSSQANLLYFLIEVTDDVAVDGFIRDVTTGNYNFDIVEVFIDEDHSGGLHVFDGTPEEGLGTNAENAFSYHIYADFPEDGQVNTIWDVGDLDGTGWGDSFVPYYADHIPGFALKKQGNLYTREFSLIVYDDTYEDDNRENARVTLAEGREMGLSLAVCDNDDPDEEPKTRDNFFGSVWVPAAEFNDHWMNADGYGRIKLIDGTSTDIGHAPLNNPSSFWVSSDHDSRDLQLNMSNDLTGQVRINVYNILGQQVYQLGLFKAHQTMREKLVLPGLPQGMYFVTATIRDQRFVQKVVLMF